MIINFVALTDYKSKKNYKIKDKIQFKTELAGNLTEHEIELEIEAKNNINGTPECGMRGKVSTIKIGNIIATANDEIAFRER